MNRDRRSMDSRVALSIPMKHHDTVLDFLNVSVAWCDGGMNMLGERRAKGFKLYLSPCRIEQHAGYTSVMSMPLSGTRASGISFCIETAERYNAKRLAILADRVNAEAIAGMFERGEDALIAEYLRNVSQGLPQRELVAVKTEAQKENERLGEKFGCDQLIATA